MGNEEDGSKGEGGGGGGGSGFNYLLLDDGRGRVFIVFGERREKRVIFNFL